MNRKTTQRLDLLKLLVKKEITLKYKRTYLGIIWSLLNPLMTAVVLFVAFKVFLRFDMENYTLFLLSVLFPWTWFSVSLTMSTNILTGNISLIKKVLFPKHFLILAMIIGQLVNFLFSIPILIILLFIYGKNPAMNWFFCIPALLLVQFAVTYGLALIIAMVNAFFRDMEHIVNVFVSLLFWMTPIIYPIDAVPEKYRIFLALNPVAYIMQGWRDMFINNTINWHNIFISLMTAVIVMLAGYLTYRGLNRRLDEVL